MSKLIERYVYDVVRRIPEKDRDEVQNELQANIYDMLSDDAGEEEIKTVLYSLGSPAAMAVNYQARPRYLISPVYYDDYIRTLKWILPLVGVSVLIVGVVFGAMDAVRDGLSDSAIQKGLSTGISSGVSAVVQVLVWVTLGFAIADRAGAKGNAGNMRGWSIDELPEPIPHDKGRIPLSESITELVFVVVVWALLLALCSRTLPFNLVMIGGETLVLSFLSDSFRMACIPVILVVSALNVCECIAKILHRRWTPLVCATIVVSNLVGIAGAIYMFTRPDVFSEEFLTFINSKDFSSFAAFDFMQTAGITPVIVILCIVIVGSLVECVYAMYKTAKARPREI